MSLYEDVCGVSQKPQPKPDVVGITLLVVSCTMCIILIVAAIMRSRKSKHLII